MTYEAIPSPSEIDKDGFCQAAAGLVENTVGRWLSDNPSFRKHGRDTFKSAAWLAVLDAYDKYDSDRNDSVEPFLIMKIRFGLLQEMNDIVGSQHGGGMPSNEWAKLNPVRRWVRLHEQAMHRSPTLVEACEAFPSENREALRNVLNGVSDRGQVDCMHLADSGQSVEDATETSLRMGEVRRWLEENATDRERTIYVMSKLEEKPYSEIGRLVGLTKQRIHQIVSRVHRRITAGLGSQPR